MNQTPQSSSFTILVAEDDMAIAEVVGLILTDAGYIVDVPLNYDEIKTMLHKKKYDLVLLDMWLWGENGGDICISLKKDEKTKHIPVIFLSAQNDAIKIGKEIEADDVLPKPFDMNLLLEKVKNLIN